MKILSDIAFFDVNKSRVFSFQLGFLSSFELDFFLKNIYKKIWDSRFYSNKYVIRINFEELLSLELILKYRGDDFEAFDIEEFLDWIGLNNQIS